MKFEAGQIVDMKKQSLTGVREWTFIVIGPGEYNGFSMCYCIKAPEKASVDVGKTFSFNNYVLQATSEVIDAV